MGFVQNFTTPNGEKMVILPKADYERLLAAYAQDADADIQEARKVLCRVQANTEPVTPLEVYKLMQESDMSRLRAWRTWRGLSSATLAKKIGRSLSYLVQIENGTRQGSLATMRLLAEALDTSIENLQD